jgi:hypothetical protein
LWIDNFLLKKGEGFTTGVSTQFYRVGQKYNNLYTYAAPYQQMVSDASITTPTTGIYIGSNFYQRGQAPFIDFNYQKSQAYFSSVPNGIVSGTYPLKDVSVLPLDISEDKLMFETKLSLRSKTTVVPTGINNDSITYPALYIKSEAGDNSPFAFGGQDESTVKIGVFMFLDSQYSLDACKSILMDASHSYIPLLTIDKFPYNSYGGFKNTGSNYNYETTTNGYINGASGLYIEDVSITSFNKYFNSEFHKLNPECKYAIAEFTLSRPRFPRSSVNNM